MEGTHKSQGALASTTAADEHDGCIALEDSFVPGRGHVVRVRVPGFGPHSICLVLTDESRLLQFGDLISSPGQSANNRRRQRQVKLRRGKQWT